MHGMSESRKRAAITSKTTAPDAWDAGLHGESDAGPIDVGLSIEPSAVGVIVDAPGVGLLKVAFDVDADGTTRLARASRRLSDGREAPLVVIDEQQVLRLEGELQRARAEFDQQLGQLTTERDEARDRAGIVSDERQKAAARRDELEARLRTVSAQLQGEKDAQLQLVNEREMLREELDAARAELARVEKALESASGLARGAEAQHQTELEWISSELKRKDEELTAANQKAGARSEEATRLSAEVEALKAELDARTLELEEARAQVDALTAEKSKLELALDRLTHEHEQLTLKHEALTKELQVSRELTAEAEGRLQALADSSDDTHREAQDRLAEELAQLTAQLDDRQRELDDARAQLQITTEELAARESQHAEAESKLSAVEAALAEANARHEEERGRYTTSESMVTAERNDARARISALDEQVQEATRSGELAVATERIERERAEQELEQLRAELTAAKGATAEARALANRLLAERDEARTVARQLNQKAAALRTERDQWQQRFKALTSERPNSPASSQDETREYQIDNPTDPNVPAVTPNKKDS